jgi:ribosomal protein S18 acetylase RimI-like enzyme
MPEIELRPVSQNDIEDLTAFEHGYYSEFVWQMSMDLEPQNLQASLRRVHLPRRVFVPYPRNKEAIFSATDQIEAFLVASMANRPVGYIKVLAETGSNVLRVSDLVVSSPMRRQGIASGLMVAVMNLASSREYHYVVMEMQSKNDPAVALAEKMGLSFSGFRDHYFPNQEMALFFSRFVR